MRKIERERLVRKDLIHAIAKKTGFTKKNTKIFIEQYEEVIEELLASGKDIFLSNFGEFKVEIKKETKIRHPKTGEIMNIPAANICKFKLGKGLKECIKR